jgi:organic hydroperoxide reductase OsmC/OhrA
MARQHTYNVTVTWTGNRGSGTSGYRDYERAHEVTAEGKPGIAGSSDAAFRGDRSRWNPEELLVAALAACHKLSYLHLCAVAGVVVTSYVDHAEGLMEESANGAGHFLRVTLRPEVILTAGSDAGKARALHEKAHELCFIANSVNFPVLCEPVISEALPPSLQSEAEPSAR